MIQIQPIETVLLAIFIIGTFLAAVVTVGLVVKAQQSKKKQYNTSNESSKEANQ